MTVMIKNGAVIPSNYCYNNVVSHVADKLA